MKKISLLVFACLATAASLFCPVYADEDPICSEAGLSEEQRQVAGCGEHPDPGSDLFATLRIVLNSVYVAVSLAAVGVIIFGGFRYSLSQGDPGKVKKAKDTIMYAIIGLIVVLSAFTITNFVLGVI